MRVVIAWRGVRAATAMLMALGVLTGSSGAAQEPVPLPTLAWQQALDAWARVPGHYGVSASVMAADGRQWSGTAGLAGAGPLQDDHLVLMASITKTMTAAIVLQLVDEEVLRLEDPIGRWLAPHANIDPDITIRQLLTHTNGLANYTASPDLGPAITADPSHVFTPAELLDFTGPPLAAPGGEASYTNTAFLLLGRIAEQATGRSIVELYHQRLWDPLDLKDVFLPGYEDPPGPVAAARSGTLVVDPLQRMAHLTIGYSALGLMATASVVARWGHALFAGDLISPEQQAAMRELLPASGTIPSEAGVGMGIRGYSFRDRVIFGHSGGSAFGSSLLLFDPESGVTVAVLMNQGQGADHFLLAPSLLEIALGA